MSYEDNWNPFKPDQAKPQTNLGLLVKRFADLHLRAPIADLDQAKRMVRRSAALGYHMVGIPVLSGATRRMIRELQNICSETKVDYVKRIDLAPRTSRELLRDLRRFRRQFEVVSVLCASKIVARQAAKDRRVDILSFSATNFRKRFFDSAEAKLASHALSAFEIDMAPLLELTGFPRIHLLSRLRQEAAIAQKFNVPIIISSGATDDYLVRGARDYAALATLFDVPTPLSLQALSQNPVELIERNRQKLGPDYLAPGLRIVGAQNND
jgi:ribonuclease P/MRP protein subunit RPP1